MSRTWLKYAFVLTIFVLAPLILGAILFDTAPKTGRNTYSTSAHGHKAFYELLRSLNYKVRRFDKSLEKAPDQGGVFVALEPGEILFRKQGVYAQSLKTWVAQGNAALISLDTDSDKLAENDDRKAQKPDWVKAAKQTINEMSGDEPSASLRSSKEKEAFRITKQSSVEVLFEHNLAAWLDDSLKIHRLHNQNVNEPLRINSSFAPRDSLTVALTRSRVFDGQPESSVASMDEHTLVQKIPIGKGLVYVLSEPRLLHNQKIGEASPALLSVRMIETLAGHAKSANIYFEEFSHGQSQAKTLGGLLTQGNMKWVLGHFFILAFIWVWFRAARVRAPKDPVHRSGSSRSEIIHSLARLYELSGDREALVQKLAEDNRRWLTSQLDDSQRGNVLDVHGERTGMSTENIEKILTPPLGRSEQEFVEYASRTAELRMALSRRPG